VQKLLETGFQDVKEMEGGFSAWQNSDYPVIHMPTPAPTPTPTLESTTTRTPTPTPAVVPTEPPLGRFRLPTRGLWVQFDQRGSWTGYWNGQVIKDFNTFDPVVGSTIAKEVELQLDAMRAMGVNTITFQLWTADKTYVPEIKPPECNISPALGLLWPQPTDVELTNLVSFFDLVYSKGINIILSLINTHMEEEQRANSKTWLTSILKVIGNHPALDLVLFDGDIHYYDVNGDGIPDRCGVPAEAPLWEGPTHESAKYVKWAVDLGRSMGIPTRKLSAEAIVGAFSIESHLPDSFATDGHQWSPINTLKIIFDELGIPDSERTYAISFYEHRKCTNTLYLSCDDEDPHTWAEHTLQQIFSVIGENSGARVIAPEMGALRPVEPEWPVEPALESLLFLMEKYGVDGGSFWFWVNQQDSYDNDPQLGDPVKRRGVEFIYNPVYKEILDMGGFHLTAIPNGSFEAGTTTPDDWTVTGSGTGIRYHLTGEPGQPATPWRGEYTLRLTTGPGANDAVSASSELIAVTPDTTYTTVANLRFGWAGDPNLGSEPSKRPRVFVSFQYFDKSGLPSSIRAQDSFSFYQEDASQGFGTFPFQYTTPGDARFVRIEVGVARNGLPTPITLDVDYLR
jgi:hypothetical protein